MGILVSILVILACAVYRLVWISRNAKDFPQNSIPVLSPAAFLGLKDLS